MLASSSGDTRSTIRGAGLETISLEAEIFGERGRIYAFGLMLSPVGGQMLATVGASDEGDIDGGGVLPTGTVTLLLADVEGSTRLWETQLGAMTDAVALLDRTASEQRRRYAP